MSTNDHEGGEVEGTGGAFGRSQDGGGKCPG